ncbi:MAG: hypothetical protein JWQ16_531 [Novosphingobium sp.]|nr:hypothetical protein [Novosphingobium sp.]
MASQPVSPAPTVSIITPAYRAATTLDRMFDSVAKQTLLGWQHIVAIRRDDAETRRSAERRARRDSRIEIVDADGTTAGTARNAALARATGEYVLFLDADDTIAPRHLEDLLHAGRAADAETVVAGFSRCSPDGAIISVRRVADRPDATSLREGPPSAIHAMLFKRSLIERIGGFDPTLRTNEDWDLCLRAAQSGASFTSSPCVSARYWTGHDSLAGQGAVMLQDRITVGRYADTLAGAAPDGAARKVDAWRTALWTGAIAIARRSDWCEIAAMLAPIPLAAAEAAEGSAALLDGFCVGFACPADAIEAKLAGQWPELEQFLAAVAVAVAEPGLDRATLRAFEAELARIGSATPARMVGATQVVNGLGAAAIELSAGCEQVVVRIPLMRPRSRATFLFAPGHAAGVRPLALVTQRLAEAASAWPGEDHPGLGHWRDRTVRAAKLARRVLGLAMQDAPEDEAEPDAQELLGEDRWEAIFSSEDPWNYTCPYETLKYERTLGLLPNQPIGRALELACAEGLFSVRLAPRVEHLTAADISPTALTRAAERCAKHGLTNVELGELDFFNADVGRDWDLIVCSEVLYYMDGPEKVRAFADRVHAALNPGGLFLHAHAYEVIDSPERTGFDWGDGFAAATISAGFGAQPGLVLERAIETELYRIELYRKTDAIHAPIIEELAARDELHAKLAADVVWNGAVVTRQAAEAERCYRFPVLMYHSIAAAGPAALADWRTTPEAFEQQLMFLRRRGYRSLSLGEWETARRAGGALSGRPILITFDDGYQDFADTAWPILQRNGFDAHVFLVAEQVGGTATWDGFYGEPARLMDWPTIARLAGEGVTFGSHLATHRPLDRMSYAETADELRRSRDLIEAHIDAVVNTVAPPYGNLTDAARDLAKAAGYDRLFGVDGGRAPVVGSRLRTPRIEITGDMDLEAFAEAIEAMEGPDGKDGR